MTSSAQDFHINLADFHKTSPPIATGDVRGYFPVLVAEVVVADVVEAAAPVCCNFSQSAASVSSPRCKLLAAAKEAHMPAEAVRLSWAQTGRRTSVSKAGAAASPRIKARRREVLPSSSGTKPFRSSLAASLESCGVLVSLVSMGGYVSSVGWSVQQRRGFWKCERPSRVSLDGRSLVPFFNLRNLDLPAQGFALTSSRSAFYPKSRAQPSQRRRATS